jgi:hypothetical protein
LFSCENWASFWKKFLLKIIVFKMEKAWFAPNWVEEAHGYLERKPSVLEAVESRILFLCENWLSFWKEYFLQLKCFRRKYALFDPNRPIQLRWRNTCISPKKAIYVRGCSI